MMKLGKAEIFAIVESGLFLIGAVFLAIVFIDAHNPLWALWLGLVFAAIGAILWLRPLLVKFAKFFNAKVIKQIKPQFAKLAKSLQTKKKVAPVANTQTTSAPESATPVAPSQTMTNKPTQTNFEDKDDSDYI